MRGQSYAEIMLVVSISALAILLSTSIYLGQSAQYRAYKDWTMARAQALDISLAVSNAYHSGNGTSANLTMPDGFSAMFLGKGVKVYYHNASADYPLVAASVSPSSISNGTYVIQNREGDIFVI